MGFSREYALAHMAWLIEEEMGTMEEAVSNAIVGNVDAPAVMPVPMYEHPLPVGGRDFQWVPDLAALWEDDDE